MLQETALFLYQLQYDSRMQQALLFDAFDVAQKLKSQRDEAPLSHPSPFLHSAF